ncbi:hypothetical protein [Streptomyces sp. V2I9]|uniref:hypothetical protein n=1 Tax=Streptomyces sp. V2I9 TaxID=3042304 RepID=UPI00278B531D|nr:hypothetical protein [Streptomyces sp. V2I9]MDQ0987058.1 hypothetical protein [Streptomyces sp. V2I9]
MFGRNQREAGTDRPFWNQRGWLFSAAFLVVALVASGAAWLSTDDDAPAARQGNPVGKGPLSSSAPKDGRPDPGEEGAATARPGDCLTDDSDQTPPSVSPQDLRWQELGLTKVPVSPSAGPVRTSGAVMWCFARTPLGAVLAAHVIPARMSGEDWQTVTDQQVVPGRARDLFVAQRSTVPPSAANGRAAGSYAGFALDSYSEESAVVQLLIKHGSGSYGTTFVTVTWDGGDWKVRANPNGTLYSSLTTVAGNNGFTMWGV